jgi:predicted nicotinamide N-methyase
MSSLRLFIINYLSDSVSVVSPEQLPSIVNSSLINYRQIDIGGILPKVERFDHPLSFQQIKIKEEYGLTIGSHIYDSSIVLLKYFEKYLKKLDVYNINTILELGAGCGVISIALSMIFRNVISTDVRLQLQLLSENIAINNSIAIVKELDWSSDEHIQHVLNLQKDIGSIDLVIACDVFYDKVATNAFFNVLNAFNREIKVVVAQKLRFDEKFEGDNTYEHQKRLRILYFQSVCETHAFFGSMLYEEADVVIWEMGPK